MNPKIDSMHFVFWFEPKSFAIPPTKFADFLNNFSGLIADWSPYILPISDEAPIEAPIMSLSWSDNKIVISKDRFNVFFENQNQWWDLSVFFELVKKIYEKIKIEEQKEWVKIKRIGFITYNQLVDFPISEDNDSYFLDFLNRGKRNGFIDWKWVKINIRIEKKKELSIGICNYIINILDVKKEVVEETTEEKKIPLLMFDINTKPVEKFIINETTLNDFFSVYEEQRNLSLNLFK